MRDSERNTMGVPAVVVEDGARPAVLVTGFAGALGAGLRKLIARDTDLHVVGHEVEAEAAALIAEHRPDAALVSNDALTGISALRRLAVAYPETAIVVAVVRLSRERDEGLLAAGARMVVPITVGTSELCGALRLVARGLVGSPRFAHRAAADRYGLLTEREAEVLELLASRRSAREIAQELYVTEATVNTHRRHIYEKLDVHNRAELAGRIAQLPGEDGPDEEPDHGALPAWDRLSFRRSRDVHSWARPSAPDMRLALGVTRWWHPA